MRYKGLSASEIIVRDVALGGGKVEEERGTREPAGGLLGGVGGRLEGIRGVVQSRLEMPERLLCALVCCWLPQSASDVRRLCVTLLSSEPRPC